MAHVPRHYKLPLRTPVIAAIIIAAIVICSWAAIIHHTSAQALGITTLLGGEIGLVDACDAGVVLTIGPPVPGQFLFQPGASKLYPFAQVYREGPWTLGTAAAPGKCFISSGKSTIVLPYEGVIMIVGTSL